MSDPLANCCKELYGTGQRLYAATEDIKRLTAEVERLRMTEAEQEALRGAVALYAANQMTNSAALLHALASRQGGGE